MNRTLTLAPLARLGQLGLDGAAALGRFGIFLGQTLFWLVVPPFKVGEVVRRIWFVGYRSLSVVVLTGEITGLVLGLQAMLMLQRAGSEPIVGPLVGIDLGRGLWP